MAAPEVHALLEQVLHRLNYLDRIEQRLAGIEDRIHGAVKDYFTVGEIAGLVGRSAYTVRRWVGEGKLAALRVEGTGPRGRLLIPRGEIEKVIGGGHVSGRTIPNSQCRSSADLHINSDDT
jgi:excisionase family DNA binding protein